MHYYKKNIGDYHKKAGRLSMLQHGSYTLLIDSCYDREEFPTIEQAIEWTWASSDEEIAAVNFVLGRFFTLEDGIYTQNRIKEELANYHKNAATNKKIAQDREAKRKLNKTKRTRTVNESPPNQEPRTTNQEPLTNIPEWINQESWKEFLNIRKKLKAVNSDIALKKILNKLTKFKDAGYNPNEIIDSSITGGWKDIYQPKTPPQIATTQNSAPLVEEY